MSMGRPFCLSFRLSEARLEQHGEGRSRASVGSDSLVLMGQTTPGNSELETNGRAEGVRCFRFC